MRQGVVVACAVGVAAIIVLACNSKTETEGPTKPKATVPSEPEPEPQQEPQPAAAASSDPRRETPPESTCSGDDGASKCFQCCEGENPGGSQIYGQALFDCVCTADYCETECAESICAEFPVNAVEGDACARCIDAATECGKVADKACEDDSACSGLAACIEKSACDGPATDGGT
jgi:hypothetical protein